MLNPSQIDVAILPSVALAERGLLPSCAGIYFAIAADNSIQYIGRTNCLSTRWNGHHRLPDLSQVEGVRLAYLLLDDLVLLPQIESALIAWFQPPLNGAKVQSDPRKSRVNYKLDSDIRAMLTRIAERQGRNEGSQVEQLVLFYEAYQQLNGEGMPTTLDAINAKVNEIWDGLTKDGDRQ